MARSMEQGEVGACGRREPVFVRLDARYECPLCEGPLQEAVQTACGHRFCARCLEGYISSTYTGEQGASRCPINHQTCDDISPNSINPDFCARREIKRLLVICPYKEFGCEETIEWRKLESHVAACRFKGAEIPCNLCDMSVPANLIQKHMEVECPRAVISCLKCGKTNMIREEVGRHENTCPAVLVVCPYQRCGCDYKGLRSTIGSHEVESCILHLQLVSKKLSETEELLQESLKSSALLEDAVKMIQFLESEVFRLQSQLDSQELRQRDLTRVVTQQSDNLNVVARKCQEFARCEMLEKHQSEMKLLQDQLLRQEAAICALKTKCDESSRVSGESHTVSFDRQLAIHDVKLAENELRFNAVESTNYSGNLVWKLVDYRRRKQEAVAGRTLSLYSQPFYTSRYGYKMCARVYLNGDGQGRNTHMSLFFVVMRGDFDNLLSWPFRQKVTMTLLDQNGGRKHLSDTFRADPSSSSFRKPISEMNIASGCPLFAAHSVVDHIPYNVDDSVFIKITVDTSDLSV